MSSPNGHDLDHEQYKNCVDSIDTAQIQTEIIDSIDAYTPSRLPSQKQPAAEDGNEETETLTMSFVRNRSSGDVYQDIDSTTLDQHYSTAPRKMITSAHTPVANIILNLGGRIRTNFRSLLNRRENIYSYCEQSVQQPTNRHASINIDTFSPIPADMSTNVDGYEVYKGGEQDNEKPSVSRSPSTGRQSSSNKCQTRLRSSSEIRGRRNTYEKK